MKLSLFVLALMLTPLAVIGGGRDSMATYISHEKVAAAFANGGGLATGPYYSVGAMHRSSPGAAEMHDKQTDVYYVEDGEATLVTGGALIDDKLVSPGQHQGSGIKGGEVHRLSKGDVVVIPAGVPHWFKAVPHSVSYLLVKADKP